MLTPRPLSPALRWLRALLCVVCVASLGCQPPAPTANTANTADATAASNTPANTADATSTTQPTAPPTAPQAADPAPKTTPNTPSAQGGGSSSPSIPPISPISEGADLATILGPVAAERDLGEPAEVSPDLQAKLAKVYTEPGDIPRLKYVVDGKPYELPLKHTHVKAEVAGGIARVQVTQTYQNPFTYPIETTYVFPLPENSAVDDMKMVIGERVIQAEIQERAQAKATYEAAKAEGKTAALLEQERPNVFTQSVANIAPGEDIDVVVRYVQDLTYDAGEYEFVFPMVVGPRFIPGAPTAGAPSGTGWAKDTDAVRDASRVSPPLVGGGMRAGQDISLELVANPGFPITQWEALTHAVSGQVSPQGTLDLMLAEAHSIPNRDFVLRYKVAAPEAQATLLSHHGDRGGFFALMIQPPDLDLEASVGARELVFVLDISGSMWGRPLSMCQDAMVQALRALRPTDTFNVVTFASGEKVLFEKPRPANEANIKEGLDFIRGLKAGGGTMMNRGVEAALAPPIEKGRHRYVFFMTDGLIGGEAQILAQTEALLATQQAAGARARVFSFGVGSSLNTELLNNIAKAGDGASILVSTREDPSRAVNTFFRYIDRPILQDVSIDWGGLDVAEVMPPVVPDLFASRALMLYGRYAKGGTATVTIKGTKDGQPFSMPLTVTLPSDASGAEVLTTLWARARIDDLRRDQWGGENPETKGLITKLGLDFHLVTEYTSLVAVDHSRVVGDGDPAQITQPVDLPEGMHPNMAGPAKSKRYAAAAMAPSPMPTESVSGLAGFSGDGSGLGGGGGGGIGSLGGGGKIGGGDVDYREKAEDRSAPKPVLKPAESNVYGVYDKQIIKRVINQKKSEITHCYQKELMKDPTLKGKISIKWRIGTSGEVESAEVASNDMGNDAVAQCLVERVKRWKFPMPKGGGTVDVTYPFTFAPAE